MPDVVIWMLRGEKRVAFARVPANQVLYSSFSEQACGKHCGRTQTVFMQVLRLISKQQHVYLLFIVYVIFRFEEDFHSHVD